MKLLGTLFAASLAITPACVSGQTAGRAADNTTLPVPVAVRDVLHAQPFTVETPFVTSGEDRATASSGTLVVLEVDPAYVHRHDAVPSPVLYAGNVRVIRLNHGDRSGRVIGIIPGITDLSGVPIWFGSPEERVTAAVVQAERARAERAGIRPFATSKIAAVQRTLLRTADTATLLRDVGAALVERFAPEEKHLAEKWRRPTVGAPRQRPQ